MMAIKSLASLILWFAISASAPVKTVSDDAEMVWVKAGSSHFEFSVDMARSASELQKGLMHRKVMGEFEGMLFVFEKVRYASFYMKNTYIPLDMIFIDRDGTIVNIVHNAKPLTRNHRRSEGLVLGVLEINGGMSERLSIGPGDTVYHPAFGNMDECRTASGVSCLQ